MHLEFAQLVNALADANGSAFVELFAQLCEHSKAHFDREKALMQASAYPSLAEHDGEHQRILGELKQYQRKVNKGAISFARAYVKDRLPEWFQLHLTTNNMTISVTMKEILAVFAGGSMRFCGFLPLYTVRYCV